MRGETRKTGETAGGVSAEIHSRIFSPSLTKPQPVYRQPQQKMLLRPVLVNIPLSSLTIHQRSLATRHTTPAQVCEARQLAITYITSHASPHASSACVSFLSEYCSQQLAREEQLISLRVTSHLVLAHNPPAPYGLKGGAAREAAVATLRVREPRNPRDLDLVRKGSSSLPDDEVLAARFMSRDYVHGARVELIRDIRRYMLSRDITLNEVVLFGDTVSLSILAALDSVGHVIRPSRYRGGSIHRKPSLDGRILLKMVRLFAEAEHYGEPAQLVGIPDLVSFSDFDLAIQLNKAFQRSTPIARLFAETLVHLGARQGSSDPLADLLEDLAHLRHGEGSLLPDAPADLG